MGRYSKVNPWLVQYLNPSGKWALLTGNINLYIDAVSAAEEIDSEDRPTRVTHSLNGHSPWVSQKLLAQKREPHNPERCHWYCPICYPTWPPSTAPALLLGLTYDPNEDRLICRNCPYEYRLQEGEYDRQLRDWQIEERGGQLGLFD